jgi:hypothetical protein
LPDYSNKTIDINQINVLLNENEYVIHCQMTIDTRPCRDSHGITHYQCLSPVIFCHTVLLWTNKFSLIEVSLVRQEVSLVRQLENIVFGCKKHGEGRHFLNKFVVDLIKKLCFDVEVYHPDPSWGGGLNLSNAIQQATRMTYAIANFNDDFDKIQSKCEIQSAEICKLKSELEFAQLELAKTKSLLETAQFKTIESTHKNVSNYKTLFDELDDLLNIAVVPTTTKHFESEIHFEELAC